MRVAVVDIGTNSTRLFVADIGAGGSIAHRCRESVVTRLGDRVDADGDLDAAAMGRVFDVLDRYRAIIDEHGADATTAVLTSAVRDAGNGAQFTRAVRERYGLDARTINGDEEAALTFAGATSERPDTPGELLVVDIGGGSTELVVGRRGAVSFHVSTQLGVVRQTERHIGAADPPPRAAVAALRDEAARIIAASVPVAVRERVTAGIAVAGTPTSCAAIELGLEPDDPRRVHGHVLTAATIARQLDDLARRTNEERRAVAGLHPDRAPTIVAGVAILTEVMRAFGLQAIEASEHDILRGAALQLAESVCRQS